MKEQEKSLDPQLWHACAGSLVQIPSVNSTVFYFPQGHAEHAHAPLDPHAPRIPPLFLCRVSAVKFLADAETDEVYAKMTLLPLPVNDLDFDKDAILGSPEGKTVNGSSPEIKPASFAKTLTQSDANNGGGFSVPRYCAETIFPRLDYTADPPVQTVIAKDIHGDTWKFRHIYRGTPRRHLLTTGWSTFVNQKKLIAGDSIVFLRSDNGGDLCVGIRRAKRGGIGSGSGPDNPFSGFSGFLRGGDDESKIMMMRRKNPNVGGGDLNSRARAEAMAEALGRAVSGQAFEVVYYPRASTPEFCVKASAVSTAMRIRWCSGMRFKMAFETEDSSRISWFMGTVSSVQVADPIRWPNSPWRLLQVAWDEPDLLQNVKRVNPWLVELVSNMPTIHLSPFSPRKKLRISDPFDFPLGAGKFPMAPPFPGNNTNHPHPLCYLTDNYNSNSNNNAPAVIQGARHAQLFGTNLLSDIQLNSHTNRFHPPGLILSGFKQFGFEHSRVSGSPVIGQSRNSDNVSCSLTIGCSDDNSQKKTENEKRHHFLLFGQPILTEQQVLLARKRSFEEMNLEEKPKGCSWDRGNDENLDADHCKVFMESEDVGRTIDLTRLGSYEELNRSLTEMFGVERLGSSARVTYRNANGALRRVGDEPFSDFMRSVKRLTITMESNNDTVRKAWITAMRNGENGMDASSKTGPLSIFA